MWKFRKNLEENIQKVEQEYKNCDDILRRRLTLKHAGDRECLLLFIEVAAKEEELLAYLEANEWGIRDKDGFDNLEDATASLLAGNSILLIDGESKAYKIATKGYPNSGVGQAESEKVIRGSKEAFSESEKANTALIRKRIRDTRLKVEERKMGVRSATNVALVYMEDLIYPSILENIKERLDSFVIDGIPDSGIIEQMTENTWYSPFPQFQTTERPDKAAMAILDGRIVLVSDNSPVALILPTDYNSFLQTTDDYYERFEIVSLTRLIRFAAALMAVFLPGLYLAVTNYHTQMLPTDLILAFAKAREGVPFSSLTELLLMELSFELLREAGVRLPGPMGNTIGIVGGLIIGQAAVDANIVSPIVVIVVALTALSSFAIPNEEFSSGFRLLKFGMIFLCSWLGMYGLLAGSFLILIHLSNLKSFGIPFLTPYVGSDLNDYQDERDALIRVPAFLLGRRPIYTKRQARVRLRKGGDSNVFK